MEISKTDPLYYDITLTVSRPTDQIEQQEGLLHIQNLIHLITKHPKEIKNFLKYLLKKLKYYKKLHTFQRDQNELLNHDQQFLQTLQQQHSTKFIFDLNKNRATKAIANLADLKQGLYHALSILNIINQKELWMDEEIINFFEISLFNFYKQTNVHNILKQGYILKQAGGRPSKQRCRCICLQPMNYSKKWFILTNQFLCYVEKPFPPEIMIKGSTLPVKDSNKQHSIVAQDQSAIVYQTTNTEEFFQLKEVLLIDNLWEYTVKKGLNKTKIRIKTNNRVLSLKFHEYNFKSWLHKINYAMDHSPWSHKLERFVESSFAPMRKANNIRLMIDGEMFFRNLAEEIMKAEFEIFITDWWLCPMYYLVRPISLISKQDSEMYRLDKLLLQAAMRGVQIYILHWRESKFAVNFNSLITKEYLQSLHPNIKMARHSSGAIQLWSHHAKLVVVDQQIAFVGGMDICYGRWDTRNHPLHDIGFKDSDQCFFPGNDYCNEKYKPMNKTEDHTFCTLDREREVRMPFHDTAVCIEGDTATDLSHHFVHLWNNAKLDKHGKRKKVNSITTHTKYRGLFRRVFKKMSTTGTTGTVSMGYKERQDRQREKEVLKKMKQGKIHTDSEPRHNYDLDDEDDKFDENLEGIISKNVNFDSFNAMQNRIKSPNKLLNLNNNNQFGRRIQNIIGLLKIRPQTTKNPPKSISVQTPRSSNKSFINEDPSLVQQNPEVNQLLKDLPSEQTENNQNQQDSKNKIRDSLNPSLNNNSLKKQQSTNNNRVQPSFETPIKKQVRFEPANNNFEKTPKLAPPSGIQETVERDSSRDENFFNVDEREPYIQQQEQLEDSVLNDSRFILHKSHTNPVLDIQANVPLDQSQELLSDVLRHEEEKQKDREEFLESKLDQRQESQSAKSLKKFNTQNDLLSPYLKTEEVQIIMHSPFTKRNAQEGQQIMHRMKQRDEGDHEEYAKYDAETSVKRNLLATFHAHGEVFIDHEVDANIYTNCTIQCLRSASPWSLGLLKVEHSIYEAYIQLIEQSQKFIYIENQFFITQSILYERNKRNIVKNKIGLALRERILRAHRHKENFFVYVFVPILPAFSGDIIDSSSSILRIQVNYQMKSMAKGKNSLVELLRQDGIEDPWQYIKFFSLRAHSVMPTTKIPFTEMIYIHSKTMIVDDQHLIIGSANINDRSMLGSRDHEIGVYISQPDPKEQIEIQMDSKPVKVSKLVHKFRTELMMEHFGVPYDQIKDPITSKTNLIKLAETNTKIHQEIFRCEPDDNISNFEQLIKLRELRQKEQEDIEAFTAKYLTLRNFIVGHAVNYPVFFLKDENLGQNFLNSEILVPEITFV